MADANHMIDREAIINVLVRFIQALDDHDPALRASTITDNMDMDLTDLNNMGFDFYLLSGKAIVAHALTEILAEIDSLHQVSNFRVHVYGGAAGEASKANLECYCLAQHFRAGEGRQLDNNDCFTVGSRYKVTSVLDDQGEWKIEKLVIKPVWTFGDVRVMKGAASMDGEKTNTETP